MSEIVSRPELATPVAGVRDVLARLVLAFREVAVITGRRSEEVAELLDVPGLRLVGLYGLEDAAAELLGSVAPLVEAAAASVPESWVEDKGVSVAVHYRQAPDAATARAALVAALQAVATESGLELIEGKMVVELVPPDRPMKGAAVERVALERGVDAALYAGDDVADADGFAGLDRLEARGLMVLRVAVRGPETPLSLLGAADLVVEGPSGLVELLGQLA